MEILKTHAVDVLMESPAPLSPVALAAPLRISNCAPAIGQCEQHHAAIRGKSATIEHSCDFLARNRWQVEAELIIVGHGVAVRCDARRTVSTPILNALRHTCQ